MALLDRTFQYFTDRYTEPGAREKFEESCYQLIRKMHSDESVFRARCAMGDEGIDIAVVDKKYAAQNNIPKNDDGNKKPCYQVFQCKYFAGGLNPSRWNQVKHSLERAHDSEKYVLTHWSLCISRTLSVDEMTTWKNIKEEYEEKYSIGIELFDGDRLIALMKEKNVYEDIFDMEDTKKLDQIFTHFIGPYDILKDFEEKNDPLWNCVKSLKHKYRHAEFVSDEFVNEFQKAFDEDKSLSDDEKNAIKQEWYYWLGRAYKNVNYYRVAEGKQTKKEKKEAQDEVIKAAMECFCQSQSGDAYYELYLYDGDEENLKKACEQKNAKACKEMARKELEKDSGKLEDAIKYYYMITGLYIKENFFDEKILNRLTEYDENTFCAQDKALIADVLYELSQKDLKLDEDSRALFFEESAYLGCNEAFNESTKKQNPLIPKTQVFKTKEEGICILNTTNERTEWFCRSLPVGWKAYYTSEEGNNATHFQCKSASELAMGSLLYTKPLYYLFIDDDLSKNLHESMELLENLRQTSDEDSYQHIRIYIRCNAEQAAPIIDTFQNCMQTTKIPVYLLDENRIAAEKLLSQHPLFYPALRRIMASENGSNIKMDIAKQTPFNLTIVGDNDCAMWLLREASWMMCLPQENEVQISGDITVLGSHAEELANKFRVTCPGLYGENRLNNKNHDKSNENWLSMPEYHFYNCNSKTESFANLLSSYFFPTNYIVVCQGSDIENMETAIQIRQLMVRKYHDNPEAMPVIAYYCQDHYFAYIGKRTVIDHEKMGHRWNNNYQIIPFGPWQIYNWENLAYDVVNDIGKCIHLSYCGKKPKDTAGLTKSEIRKELSEFYDREYNRDSSISNAFSLPYRLYITAFVKGKTRQEQKDYLRKFFPRWRFEEDDYFFGEEGANRIAKVLEDVSVSPKKLFANKELEIMGEWEHYRWTCWTLSRGYLPMSPETMVQFVAHGNNRQNLAIGKLHALICPFKMLPEIERRLSAARNDNRESGYLRKSNFELIQISSNLWKRAWLKKEQ